MYVHEYTINTPVRGKRFTTFEKKSEKVIVHGKTLISDDVASKSFVCDLNKCKGACCVAGDLGAPLTEDELDVMEEMVDIVRPYLSREAWQMLDMEGPYLLDEDGDFSTRTIGGNECAFVFYDENSIAKCSIEQAWKDGKTDFRKPISCHLYPIRLGKTAEYETLNYDKWSICSPACDLGEKLKVPVYVFLKDALIRKYGEAWYNELAELIEKDFTDGLK